MEWYANKPEWQVPPVQFSVRDPWRYHRSLEAYRSTALVEISTVNLPVKLLIKDESSRFGLEAFKGLGASYAIHRFVGKYGEPVAFCTATDGNHGRAVAWSAVQRGIPAFVFMPRGTVAARVEAIEALGASVEVTPWNYDQTVEYACKMAEENHWALIQDTAWHGYEEIPHWIMEGYLTQMVEITEQLKSITTNFPDIIFLQSGVGSWAASVVWYVRQYLKRSTRIVLVEPENAAGSLASARARKRLAPDASYKTIMAGLNCGIPSLLAWPILQNGVDLFLAIKDKNCWEAIEYLKQLGMTTSATGAAGFAGLLAIIKNSQLYESLGLNIMSTALLFNTEGNTSVLSN